MYIEHLCIITHNYSTMYFDSIGLSLDLLDLLRSTCTYMYSSKLFGICAYVLLKVVMYSCVHVYTYMYVFFFFSSVHCGILYTYIYR